MNKKLEVVDFLRGFAIFTIALMHLVQGSLTGALNKAAALGGAVVGMGLTGAMGWIGGVLKLYNDIPSLMGYLSLLLVVYKLGSFKVYGLWFKVYGRAIEPLAWVKRFFMWASGFGYELYLVHSLTYVVMKALLKDLQPLPIWIAVTFVVAYVLAWCYSLILKKTIYRK